MRSRSIWISPASNRSMPPSRLRSVVLPEPEGPITATKSPRGIDRSRRSKMVIVSLPFTKALLRPTRRTSGASDIDCVSPLAARRASSDGRYAVDGFAVIDKSHFHRHVRKDTGIFLLKRNPHLDGRL